MINDKDGVLIPILTDKPVYQPKTYLLVVKTINPDQDLYCNFDMDPDIHWDFKLKSDMHCDFRVDPGDASWFLAWSGSVLIGILTFYLDLHWKFKLDPDPY